MPDNIITELTATEVLARVPQQEPFRFIDEISKLSAAGITANYTFKENLDFYRGHFPGNPITPGVILLEASAQTAVVAYGIYLASLDSNIDVANVLTLFTEAQVEFSGIVRPNDKIIVQAEKQFFRRLKLKVNFTTKLASGKLVCSGVLAGQGVINDK